MSFRIETRGAWKSARDVEGKREPGAGERADEVPEDCCPAGFHFTVGKLPFSLTQLYE